MKKLYHNLRFKIENVFFKYPSIYRKHLSQKLDLNQSYLSEVETVAVLKNKKIIEKYTAIVKRLGLPVRSDQSKNWDSLIAYKQIVEKFPKDANILDAGAEVYSSILPWLFLTGYQHLYGNNIIFKNRFKRGTILYDYGDITKTDFPLNFFDAITCLSVVEHGVELDQFFKEMSRLLKPGGILVLSTDYYETSIETKDKFEYGHQIKIFNKNDIRDMINQASKNNLNLITDQDLNCAEKPVHWERFGLEYTYVCLTFEKI